MVLMTLTQVGGHIIRDVAFRFWRNVEDRLVHACGDWCHQSCLTFRLVTLWLVCNAWDVVGFLFCLGYFCLFLCGFFQHEVKISGLFSMTPFLGRGGS